MFDIFIWDALTPNGKTKLGNICLFGLKSIINIKFCQWVFISKLGYSNKIFGSNLNKIYKLKKINIFSEVLVGSFYLYPSFSKNSFL